MCQFDFACAPVDVGVVLHEPGVSQVDCLMADARDIKVTFVLDNEINCFSDLSNLVWLSICIIQPDRTWVLIGPKFMHSDKLVVNKLSLCAAVYQCFHCQWTVAVDCMDLDRDIGGPLKYLVSKGLYDSLFPFRLCISQFGCFRF